MPGSFTDRDKMTGSFTDVLMLLATASIGVLLLYLWLLHSQTTQMRTDAAKPKAKKKVSFQPEVTDKGSPVVTSAPMLPSANTEADSERAIAVLAGTSRRLSFPSDAPPTTRSEEDEEEMFGGPPLHVGREDRVLFQVAIKFSHVPADSLLRAPTPSVEHGRAQPPKFANQRKCWTCKKQFTLLRLRHHCRNCGHSFCLDHAKREVILSKYGFKTEQRVCDVCFAAQRAPERADEPVEATEASAATSPVQQPTTAASALGASTLAPTPLLKGNSTSNMSRKAPLSRKQPPRFANAQQCHKCHVDFRLGQRHHCRNCGRSFCIKHSSKLIQLKHLGFSDTQRVCDECFGLLHDGESHVDVQDKEKGLSKVLKTVSDALVGSADQPPDGPVGEASPSPEKRTISPTAKQIAAKTQAYRPDYESAGLPLPPEEVDQLEEEVALSVVASLMPGIHRRIHKFQKRHQDKPAPTPSVDGVTAQCLIYSAPDYQNTKSFHWALFAIPEKAMYVVAMRAPPAGTSDALTDIAALPNEWLAVNRMALHAAFTSPAKFERIGQIIAREMLEHPAWAVRFTGHSAGGAIAACMYLSLLSMYPFRSTSSTQSSSDEVDPMTELPKMLRHPRSGVTAFGAPLCFFEQLSAGGLPGEGEEEAEVEASSEEEEEADDYTTGSPHMSPLIETRSANFPRLRRPKTPQASTSQHSFSLSSSERQMERKTRALSLPSGPSTAPQKKPDAGPPVLTRRRSDDGTPQVALNLHTRKDENSNRRRSRSV
eukprot:g60210.t1